MRGEVGRVAGGRTARADRRFRRGRDVGETLEDPMAHLVDARRLEGEVFIRVEGDEVRRVSEVHVNVGHDV